MKNFHIFHVLFLFLILLFYCFYIFSTFLRLCFAAINWLLFFVSKYYCNCCFVLSLELSGLHNSRRLLVMTMMSQSSLLCRPIQPNSSTTLPEVKSIDYFYNEQKLFRQRVNACSNNMKALFEFATVFC